MKNFILFKNGGIVGTFSSERAARLRFIKVCSKSSFEDDEVTLIDLDNDGETIAFF